MSQSSRTSDEIKQEINCAKHSTIAINDVITKLANGSAATMDLKDIIQRNVDHLNIIVAKDDVNASGEDLAVLNTGISVGNAKLAENIWPAE